MTEIAEWGSVDVDAYLERIGAGRDATLTELAKAHVEAIPFENVDVVLGQHRGIGLDVVQDKLVGRRRGGYCYEQAGLFGAVAEALGYQVRRVAARVQPRRPGPATHMALVVDDQLVDVGFGDGILVPMPLVDGAEVSQAGWVHRLSRDNDLWTLQKQHDDGWEDLHAFTLTEMHRVDYEVYHHYTSTHPRSPFTGRLVLMRATEGLLRRMVGRELTLERPDGTRETATIAPEALDKTLRGLDIELTDDELERLLKVY